MPVDVKIDGLEVLRHTINNIKKDFNQNLMDILIADIMAEVVRLANKGRNADNESLIAYSQAYVKHRVKQGLRAKPNFQYSSSMINSLSSYKRKNEWRIGVSGADANGVSNAFKLAKVEKIKNYQLLFWSNHLDRLIDKHIKRYKRKRKIT